MLLKAAAEVLQNETYQFYVGTSYRHCLIWANGSVVPLTPPHDVLGQVIGAYLPKDARLREMQEKSYEILSRHPLNIERVKKGTESRQQPLVLGSRDKAGPVLLL